MKKLIILMTALFTGLGLFAQHEPLHMREKKEKMDAMKAAFITENINLTPEESQQFWPIYNEMDKKIETLRMATAEKVIKIREEGKSFEDMSEEYLVDLMNEQLNNDEKIAKIKKEYHAKFIKVLGVKKTAMLYQAERGFARELMRRSRRMDPKEKGKPEHE